MTARYTLAAVSIDKDAVELILGMPDFALAGIFDPAPGAVLGVPVVGTDNDWPAWHAANPAAAVILLVDPPQLRARLAYHYGPSNLVSVISPDAHVAASATIGTGTLIQRSVVVSADVRIGRSVKINIGATIHHDVSIGDDSTVAPGARLLGNVTIGTCSYVGAGAVILPRRRVGANVTIGAGAVVVDDVADGETVVGVPAKPLKRVKEQGEHD